MPINRKTSIIVSSLTAGALAIGAAGVATAAMTADTTARHAAAARPAPDPATVRSEVNELAAAAKAIAPLKAALADRPDAARVGQLVDQAKRAMDDMARISMSPHANAPRPDDSVARAVPQLKRRLDEVARAAAAPNPNGDLINSVNGVLQGLLQLLVGTLNTALNLVHTPAPTA